MNKMSPLAYYTGVNVINLLSLLSESTELLLYYYYDLENIEFSRASNFESFFFPKF